MASKTRSAFIALVLAGVAIVLPSTVQADEPEIVDVLITKETASGKRVFEVSILHNDTGVEHYATDYQVLTLDGKLITNRVLLHPHVNEQPFTRNTSGKIPKGVTEVLVRARDKVHGFGKPLKVRIPQDGSGIYVERRNDGSIVETPQ